jgi:hypothetical protein
MGGKMSAAIEEFAKILVREVRDNAVRSCDALLQPNAGSAAAQRWKELGVKPSEFKIVIPDLVDEVVFSLLNAIDLGSLRLKFVSSDASEVDLLTEGQSELAGWYMMSGGWRRYSAERFFDDLADMDSDPVG